MDHNSNSAVGNRTELVITRTAKNEDNEFVKVDIPLAINCTRTGRILINSPGLGGSKDGDEGVFLRIAEMLEEKGVASMIRYESSLFDFAFRRIGMEALLMDNLRAVLNYALGHSRQICGSDSPEVFLAGYSADASATAAVSVECPQVSKMLLIAPSIDIDLTLVEKSLSKFAADLYLISGDRDRP